jgi:hypothetical protein
MAADAVVRAGTGGSIDEQPDRCDRAFRDYRASPP